MNHWYSQIPEGLQEGRPSLLQGPENGLSDTRKWAAPGDTCADRAGDSIKGCPAESRRVGSPGGLLAPWFAVLGLWWRVSFPVVSGRSSGLRVLPGGTHTSLGRDESQSKGCWGVRRTNRGRVSPPSLGPFPNPPSWFSWPHLVPYRDILLWDNSCVWLSLCLAEAGGSGQWFPNRSGKTGN